MLDDTHYEGKEGFALVDKAQFEAMQAEVERLRKQVQHSLANNLCPDHRDKQAGKTCLACEVERLQGIINTALSLAKP